MSRGLTCSQCGGLLHVGVGGHLCDSPSVQEARRRYLRAQREAYDARFAQAFASVLDSVNLHTYIVVPEPPRDASPIRVVAHVGRPVLELEAAGQDVIEGELA